MAVISPLLFTILMPLVAFNTPSSLLSAEKFNTKYILGFNKLDVYVYDFLVIFVLHTVSTIFKFSKDLKGVTVSAPGIIYP